MANTRLIKRRINAATNISKITKAMEMVSASKMKRAQDQALAARPFSRAIQESLQKLSERVDTSLHPLLSPNSQGYDVALLLSTDKGLCGGLNAHLFKAVSSWYKGSTTPQVIAVGRKAVTFSRLAGLQLHAQFTDLPEKVKTEDIVPISRMLLDGYLSQTFRSVTIIYMDFINTLSQQVRTVQLLPLQQGQELTQVDRSQIAPQVESEYMIEPSPKELLDQLLPFYIENGIYQAFLEARASEHSARMVTMKSAKENAQDLVSELKLEFNKSRQAGITNELLDITTAALTIT